MRCRALGLAALAVCAMSAWAEEPLATPAHEDPLAAVDDLERAFWYCDYIATTRGVLAAPMAACRFATEELKKAKFGGDFNALVAWWRANKPVEHDKLALRFPP